MNTGRLEMDVVLERLARAEAVEQLLRVLVGLDVTAQRAAARVALAYLDQPAEDHLVGGAELVGYWADEDLGDQATPQLYAPPPKEPIRDSGKAPRECAVCGDKVAGGGKFCSTICEAAFRNKGPKALDERKLTFLRAVKEFSAADAAADAGMMTTQLCPDCEKRGLEVRLDHGAFVVSCAKCPVAMKYRYAPADWEGYDSAFSLVGEHSVVVR